jgi:hypothetical protein
MHTYDIVIVIQVLSNVIKSFEDFFSDVNYNLRIRIYIYILALRLQPTMYMSRR